MAILVGQWVIRCPVPVEGCQKGKDKGDGKASDADVLYMCGARCCIQPASSSVHPFIRSYVQRRRAHVLVRQVDVHFLTIYISPWLRHSVRPVLPPGMAWQMLLTTSQYFICFTTFIEPQGASHSEHEPTNPLHFKRTDATVCQG